MIRENRSFVVLSAILSYLAICGWASDSQGDVLNVANLYGTASQSTTGFSLPAVNAINGVTTGDATGHTATGDLAPFWQVDLGSEFAIQNINLFNRTNCCGERLYNVTVDILDASATSVFTSSVFNSWDGIGTIPDNPGAGPFNYDMTALTGGFVTGQTVRISKAGFAGSEWLSLLEVEVFAEATPPPIPPELDPDINVALNKPTSGDVAFGYPTSNGNDGDVSNFTHADNTNASPDNPFWMVDLQGEFRLSHIEIVDRATCCDPNRLEGSTLTVLDASMTPIYTSDPISGLSVPSSGELLTFDNGGAGFYGAAHIRVDGANQYFQFAELRAYAIPEPSAISLLVFALVSGLVKARTLSNLL